jgi:cytochrome c-type protein NapB
MKFLITLVMAAGVFLGAGAATAQEINEIGGVAIEKDSRANIYRPEKDSDPIPRNFQKQPPLIPHSIQGYEVSKNFNKCMDCHSKDRAEATGATKVAKSHYLTRDDDKLKNISPRRYFCMQCHVPQFDAKPLVENTYKPATKN